MNENLIFEGNTIYEIDPVCIKNKNIQAEYIDLTFAKPYIKLIPKEDKK